MGGWNGYEMLVLERLDCIEKRWGGDCNADGWHKIGNGIMHAF